MRQRPISATSSPQRRALEELPQLVEALRAGKLGIRASALVQPRAPRPSRSSARRSTAHTRSGSRSRRLSLGKWRSRPRTGRCRSSSRRTSFRIRTRTTSTRSPGRWHRGVRDPRRSRAHRGHQAPRPHPRRPARPRADRGAHASPDVRGQAARADRAPPATSDARTPTGSRPPASRGLGGSSTSATAPATSPGCTNSTRSPRSLPRMPEAARFPRCTHGIPHDDPA